MKIQILNNEQIGFYDEGGNLKATMKTSGSDLVIEPAASDGNIVFGENAVRDVEIGNEATPVEFNFLGGGTITSNGNTLYLGDPNNNDNIIISNTTIGSSVVWSTGLSGSFSGSHYGSFFGDGRGLVGITATVEPAGPVGSIQFNDDINNSGSSDFIFNKTTGAVTITGSVNVSGSTTADFFFGNGAGLTGITSTFAPTGQDKSIQFNKGGTEISGSDGILFDYDNNNLNVKGYISASLLTGSATLTGSFTGDLNGDGTNITNVVGNTTFTGNPEIAGILTTTGLNLTGSINISGSESSEIKILDDSNEAGLMLKNYGYGSRLGLFTSRGTSGGFSATGNGIHWSNSLGGGQDVIINSRNGGYLRANGDTVLSWGNGGYIDGFNGIGDRGDKSTKNFNIYSLFIDQIDDSGGGTDLIRLKHGFLEGHLKGQFIIEGCDTQDYDYGQPGGDVYIHGGKDFFYDNGEGNVILAHTTSSEERGYVGINTNNPTSNLHVSGTIKLDSNQIDFTNLPTTDPGVAGRLFQTGSEAIGATAGFQLVLISQG